MPYSMVVSSRFSSVIITLLILCPVVTDLSIKTEKDNRAWRVGKRGFLREITTVDTMRPPRPAAIALCTCTAFHLTAAHTAVTPRADRGRRDRLQTLALSSLPRPTCRESSRAPTARSHMFESVPGAPRILKGSVQEREICCSSTKALCGRLHHPLLSYPCHACRPGLVVGKRQAATPQLYTVSPWPREMSCPIYRPKSTTIAEWASNLDWRTI